jgi:plasmid stabilization system protein ParE
MQLYIQQAARKDIGDIWTAIARNNVACADDYIERLYALCRMLAAGYISGRRCDELSRGIYYLRRGKDTVFYRQDDGAVVVIRLFRAARRSQSPLTAAPI